MPFVGKHCKNLTSLECEFDDKFLIYNADHFVQAFTQLDKLKCIKITMNDKSDFKTVDLSGIINSLPEEINEIYLFSPSQRKTVPMSFKKFTNLQKLTVHGLCSGSIFPEIAEKTTLVYLHIQLSNKFFLFNKLVNLEHIDLTLRMQPDDVFDTDTDTDLTTKVLDTIFCTCKNLKHLDIPRGPYDLAKISLKKWINFQNLEYLRINGNIMPDLANTIVQYCKNLKDLRIDNRHHCINETALKKLTELENLECLVLPDCNKLSDESIIAISNNCKKLKKLEIPAGYMFDSRPSPSVLHEISKLQYLEHLKLFMVKSLKDSTITAIANNCKYLKSLDIGCCRAITETGLGALTKLENLQKLDVRCIDIITDSFISKLKGLKELDCGGCRKLTDDGIIQVIKNSPDLTKIDVRNTIITINSSLLKMSAKRTCVEKDRQTFNDGDKDQKLEINSLDYDSLAKIFMLLPIPERIDMEEGK
ncbi:F-box/LRR-repeat protein 2-like [Aphidius gifuensis]|uniref:F-box/LRR-repeat protein 2-like n=1 Tax=Aphidius gifuensis TaxID=684658 RepID=UPI001CDC9FB8|nr:F-box/LRR-repeat protein 2-like [Aphidius gifuensis]